MVEKKEEVPPSVKEGEEPKAPKLYEDPETGDMVSKNELKKRQKLKKKREEEQKKKELEEAKKMAAEEEKKKEELDPTEYLENRRSWIQGLKDAGKNPYPHKFQWTHRLRALQDQFKSETVKNEWIDTKVAVTGRVLRVGSSGKKLYFFTIEGDDTSIQIFGNLSLYKGSDFEEVMSSIKRGDIIGVVGNPGATKTGEFSVAAHQIMLLSYCLHMLPKGEKALKDKETRYRQRYLDMMINQEVKNTFVIRAKIINYIRKFFTDLDFVEVETPMMNTIAGGAAARPFTTNHNDLNLKLYMRIAPELFLKMLIVGGMERVFEIGKNFRNESIDLTHNPEFTACEFYMAYADYNDLMKMTEDLISGMVHSITGGYKIKYHPEGKDKDEEIEIDFTPPWPRVSMVHKLEEILGVEISRDFDALETRQALDALCVKHEVECGTPRTPARLLDKLVGHFIEPKCINPTFITNHPSIMCPLAKWHRDEKGLTERFQLFVNGHELCNSYTELNDPKVQRQEFLRQAGAKQEGDEEAWQIDEGFCTALEYGLPPTGGWGIGIDRLAMLLTDNNSIKEVLLFPAMKPLPGQPGYKEPTET